MLLCLLLLFLINSLTAMHLSGSLALGAPHVENSQVSLFTLLFG